MDITVPWDEFADHCVDNVDGDCWKEGDNNHAVHVIKHIEQEEQPENGPGFFIRHGADPFHIGRVCAPL